MKLGYRVILAADALGATDAASLAATCRTIYRSFGDVRSNADLVDLLDDRTGWPSRA